MRKPDHDHPPAPKPAAEPGLAAAADAEALSRARARSIRERSIDEQLAQSFPASDPPGWTMGATPAASAEPPADDRGEDVAAADVPGGRAPRRTR
jgi:hypothetical protein